MFACRYSSMLTGLLALALVTGCGRGVAPQGALDLEDAEMASLEVVERVVVPDHPTRPPAPATDGNTVKFHVTPTENVAALKRVLGAAQHSIAIEMYNFIDDSMGKPIADLLVEKARAGVKVQVVADMAGCVTRKGYRNLAKRLRAAGVEFRIYRLRAIIKDDHWAGLNITHRKLYLVDGEVGLVGGVNLRAPFDTNTQDALLEWRGPIVSQLYSEFGTEWAATKGKNPLSYPPAAQLPGGIRARVAVTSAREGRFEIRDAVYRAVENAQQEIRIENQYLWDDRLMKRLDEAVKRGVKVRVIIPGDEDKGVFKYVHSEEMKRLTDLGGQARLYHGDEGRGHLHVKYFGIDDKWVALGSCNGDTRAFMDNQEMDALTEDPTLAAEIQQRLFETDWAQNSVPFVYKPSSLITRPFRSLLELLDYFM